VIDRRSEYLKRKNTPTPFNQGPEMQNYNRMMDLQSQAPNFTQNDPRLNELKDVRRQYNRFDKYKIGERQGVAPLDVQKQFSNQSNMFRNAAPNAYATMYPIQNLAMKYGESGGLLGMLAKEAFGKAKQASSGIQSALKTNIGDPIRAVGSDIASNIGIGGAVDSNEAEMQDYAAQTFPMGTPYPQQDFFVDAETFGERDVEIPRMDDDVGDFYEYDKDDNIVLSPERPMPFDDSNREAGIMSQYPGTNFIGPRDDPNRRPTMADVAGPMYPGLIPYPEYLNEPIGVIQQGRGELPGYPNMYDYDAERKGREDSLRLRQLLDFINNQEIQQEPSRINLR
jgi:hypothetical protein